jgi:hypothetical protein
MLYNLWERWFIGNTVYAYKIVIICNKQDKIESYHIQIIIILNNKT